VGWEYEGRGIEEVAYIHTDNILSREGTVGYKKNIPPGRGALKERIIRELSRIWGFIGGNKFKS